MFEPLFSAVPASRLSAAAAPSERVAERRDVDSEIWQCIVSAFDAIDYGMLLLDGDAQVMYVNAAARAALDGEHPLRLGSRSLQARSTHDANLLHRALADAAERGLRKPLSLGTGARQVGVAVVPLGVAGADGRRAVLVMLEKRALCASLALQGFAREHRLTPSETRVLLALCAGARPADAAQEHGVALSTVRSQIKSIRIKTGASSISALVRWLASLPPLMGVLREGGMAQVTHEAMARLAA